MEFTGMIDGTKTKGKVTKIEGGGESRMTVMEIKVVLPYSANVAAFTEARQCEAMRFNIEPAQEELNI